MSSAHATDVATRLLDAFADDAVLRGLVPGRLREEHRSARINLVGSGDRPLPA